jgi:ParB/RepB/Spo0J family partition protein
MPEYKYIPIEQLVEPPNPIRATMDEAALASLCESIKLIGVLQPLLVVRVGELVETTVGEVLSSRPLLPEQRKVMHEIVAGHRRYKACIMANLNAVPCLVFADAEIARHAAMLQENTEREDITPAEEAIFFAELIERYDYTEEALCKAVKKSTGYIYARLDLLRGNQEVFTALREKKINMAVAAQLNRCPDPGHTSYLLSLAITGGATAATVSKWVTDYKAPSAGETVTAAQTEGKSGQSAAAVTDDRVCVLCRRSHQPLNLVPVWVHDWELRDLNERMDNAANVDLEPNKSAQGA